MKKAQSTNQKAEINRFGALARVMFFLLSTFQISQVCFAGTNAAVTFRTNDFGINPTNLWRSNSAALIDALTNAGFTGATVQASNILSAVYPSQPATNLVPFGESIDFGAAAQYPGQSTIYSNANTLSGMYGQWAASMGITMSNYAIVGINSFRQQTDGSSGYVHVPITSNEIICAPGSINDLATALDTNSVLRDNILLQWIQPVLLANESLACWISQDRHPSGSDILAGGNHYGYTNGTGPWLTAAYPNGSTPLWLPFMSGAILSTNIGDKITLTNITGPCVLLYDEWESNSAGFGGTMAISVDGSAFTNVNCTMTNFLLQAGTWGATNNIAAKLFNLSWGAVHTMIISNAGGNIGYECLLERQNQTATNAVFVRNCYNTPFSTVPFNGVYTFTNQLTNILVYNQMLLSNVLALDSIGLPVKYVDVFSVMQNSTNYFYLDNTHANLLGYIAMAAEFDYVATGNPGHFAAFLASGKIVNPYCVPSVYNGNPNYTGTVTASNVVVSNGMTVGPGFVSVVAGAVGTNSFNVYNGVQGLAVESGFDFGNEFNVGTPSTTNGDGVLFNNSSQIFEETAGNYDLWIMGNSGDNGNGTGHAQIHISDNGSGYPTSIEGGSGLIIKAPGTVSNGLTLTFTNAAPTGITWGTTTPDKWFPITYGGTNYMVAGFHNH